MLGIDGAEQDMSETATDTEKPLYVIGHRNPDADAICAAIGYAEFLRQTGETSARAACCGEINARTMWVLNYAGVEPPSLLMDVRPTAASICRRDVTSAHPGETFLEVYQRIVGRGVRNAPVVDADNNLLGLTSLQEVFGLLMPSGEVKRDARQVKASLENIAKTLDAEIDGESGDVGEEELVVMVAASSEETFLERLHRYPPRWIVVIAGDRPGILRDSIEYGVRCIIITGGFDVPEDLRAEAVKKDVCFIRCEQDSASAAQLIRCARLVDSAKHKKFLSFGSNTLVKSIRQEIQDKNQPLFPVVVEGSTELLGVFSKSDLINPPRVRLVLVDHNEFSQAVTGAEEAEILEVIDHHRLSGNLRSKEPIRFINEPVGSTSTIVARMFRSRQLVPPRGIAICLCAGLISDTLLLTSPTTTTVDRDLLQWLSDVAMINPEHFAKDFFAAGSVLRGSTPSEVICSDRKEFVESGWRLSISQIEELGLDAYREKEEGLQEELEAICRKDGLDLACLMVTDITRHYSLLLTAGNPDLTEVIDYPRLRPGVFELDGVVSRKKQLFPRLGRLVGNVVNSD